MRCYQFAPEGDAYRLELLDRPEPSPGPGRVVVRVSAVSLNHRDLILLAKSSGLDVSGKIPVSDGVGEVVAIGAGVRRVRIGDRVAGCFFQTWIDGRFELAHHKAALGGGVDGMLAELVELHEEGIVPAPEHLTDEEVACLPCAGLTAWTSLVERGGLRPGDSVLVLGTGGVSVFALQIAAALGCQVYVTSKSEEKLERARSMGAAGTINYLTHPEWDRELWGLTGKRGVDHIVEVGGAGTLGRSLNSLAAGGHLALVGVLAGFGPPTDSLFPLLARNARVSGIYVGSRAQFESLNRFLAAVPLHPVIDRVFPFTEAPEAFRYFHEGAHFGKIVIRLE